MRLIFHAIVFLVIVAALGCKTAQKQWRKQFLISHHFHLQEPKVGVYERHYNHLGDAARDLGFSVTNLTIPINGSLSPPDVRVVMLHNWGFVITADGTNSLDELSTACTVGTALVQYHDKQYLPPMSHPRLRIKSVTEPLQPSRPLQITFEIMAVGKGPLV